MGSEQLKQAIRRLRGPRKAKVEGQLVAPGSAFEAVLEQRLKELELQLGELKGRVNWLFFLIIGAMVTNLVMRLVE